jgi:peptidoglycan-associated lipoprotein
MMTRKILVTLSLSLLFITSAMAQSKLAEEANDAFAKGFYFNAIELYKKAYTVEKKASTKAELIFKVAESYRALGDMEQAEQWYERANKAQYSDPITYFYIGESLKQQGKYPEAIAAYNRYKEKKPNDSRADAAIAICQQAQKWKDSPTRYSVDPEVMLNSPQMDFTPAFADKKNETVVYTSTRQAATGTETDMITGENFSDLFTSTRDRLGKWSEPTKLPIAINTPGNEGAPIFNAKRTIMYFTRCPMEKKKVYGCDIWMSKKVGANYSEPVMLPLKGSTGKDDTLTVGHPAISSNDEVLVFASNSGAGHKGGRDLYMVKLNKDGMPIGTPVNLGADINTPKDELFPFLRFDGSLYFASNGYPGMGGLDIYRAESTGENAWGQVANVQSPLNSAHDDFAMVFDGENDRGFFTSTRPGGKGLDDIWRFYMPDMIFALQGTVYDKLTGQPLPGAKVSVVGTNGSNFSALTDDNGGFAFVEKGKNERFIVENTSYSILAEKEGYLVVKDQVTTVGLAESTTFVKEYYLQPATKEIVIKLPEVQYDLGKYSLRPEGQDSLLVLYQTLIDNPTIIIELAAHTDTRGSDASNDLLSQNRAQSCVNFLVTKGIDPARMIPKGYGERKVRITDAQIAAMKTNEEREAAHQQNRRTEFRVLSFDYQPKEGNGQPAPNN